MPFCTTTCLWALAFTFTSLVATAGEPPVNPVAVASLELEARLAKKPAVYLKLSLNRRVLEVKARGLVLDSFPIKALEAAERQALFIKPKPLRLPVPSVLQVLTGPGDTDREVIAPKSLRPARKTDEEEEPTPTPASNPHPTPTKPPETPSRYRVELTNGLLLWVTDNLPVRGFLARFGEALREGWEAFIYGRKPPQEPPGIVMVVDSADARRLHHLFRNGLQILVVSEAIQ